MSYILINDEILKQEKFPKLLNRGFLYGDGFFETIRVYDGLPLWLDLHQERIDISLEKLQMKKSPFLFKRQFSRLIWDLIESNKVTNGRLRINFFRDAEGYYLPLANDTSIVATVEQLEMPLYHLNIDGLYVELSEEVELHQNYLSSLKTFGRVNQVLASLEARKRGFDELLLKNSAGNVAEAISSNVYLIKGKEAITPPMTEGAVFGIMRSVIMPRLKEIGLELSVRPFDMTDFAEADEMWLCNSVKGIQWVAGFRKKRYFCDKAKQMTNLLQASVV